MFPHPALTIEHTRPFMAACAASAITVAALRLAPHYLQLSLPRALPHLPHDVDPGVVMLFAPLCALMLAVLFLAVRLIGHEGLPDDGPPHARAIPHWQDAGD